MDAAHPRVLGYLGRALSLELSAVQQYMTHASLAEAWGDQESADRFRRETVEEMRHAEIIIQRMLRLGVAPAASQLRPVGFGPDLIGLLHRNAELEELLVNHYADAVRFCGLIADGDHRGFFEELWRDESHHAEDLASWLASLGADPALPAWRATMV
jgi:bacterioferritin